MPLRKHDIGPNKQSAPTQVASVVGQSSQRRSSKDPVHQPLNSPKICYCGRNIALMTTLTLILNLNDLHDA